jgi:hypothetical protein
METSLTLAPSGSDPAELPAAEVLTMAHPWKGNHATFHVEAQAGRGHAWSPMVDGGFTIDLKVSGDTLAQLVLMSDAFRRYDTPD